MSQTTPLIAAWARSAVVPRHGAFKTLHPHEIAAPVIQSVLSRAHIEASQVDAVIVGNALGAGGNPARMAALYAGIPTSCRALSVDTQCCAGLDAVALGASLIQAGQAHVVIAGGVEAWSRAPIRMHRPLHADEIAVAYERPAFSPFPEQDPDMLMAASDYAKQHGLSRAKQDAYAIDSHARALSHMTDVAQEIVPIMGVSSDAQPRVLQAERVVRMPEAAPHMSVLAVSAQADGAAFVLLLSEKAAQQYQTPCTLTWLAHTSVGCAPQTPMLAATEAAREVLKAAHLTDIQSVSHIELHDAFAAQGLNFCQTWGIAPERINRKGGGLVRGHPIGASGAVALVRVCTDLSLDTQAQSLGLATIAGAGGLGSAALVRQSRL